ncbi:MAG: GIY-YIG nuclease family protein [Luminiphilus sp.]|nr:GIY-YIG nuclease family protein [Luminiphilus sp.]
MESEIQYKSGIYVLSGTHGGDTVVKGGCTTSGVCRRVAQLNEDVCAGVDDWHCVCWYEESNVRLVNAFEKMAHDELERFHNAEKGGYSDHFGVSVGVSEVHQSREASNCNGFRPKYDSHHPLQITTIGGHRGPFCV